MGAFHVRFGTNVVAHEILSKIDWIAAVTKYRFGLSTEKPRIEIFYSIQVLKSGFMSGKIDALMRHGESFQICLIRGQESC